MRKSLCHRPLNTEYFSVKLKGIKMYAAVSVAGISISSISILTAPESRCHLLASAILFGEWTFVSNSNYWTLGSNNELSFLFAP